MAESDETNGTADVLNYKRRNSEALSDNDGHGEAEAEDMQRLHGIQFPAAEDSSSAVSTVQGFSGYDNVSTSPTRESLDGATNSAEMSDRLEETSPDKEYRQHGERLEYDESLDSGGGRHDLSPSPEEIKSVIVTSQDSFSGVQQDLISDLAVDVAQRLNNVVPDVAETIDKVITYEDSNQASGKAILVQNVDNEVKGIQGLSTWIGSPLENIQGSRLSNQQGEEHADEFFQVPLQESESMSSKISASPSFLERIRLASFGHDRTVETPSKDNERSEINVESVNDNNDAAPNFAFDSVYDSSGDSSFYSSVALPLVQGKAILPNASAELMHLIDSAIQGSDPSNLEKLKCLVAEDKCHEEDTGQSSSQVVVNVLLAKMGAPEGPYDEKDAASPRMMLSVGAAMVAGELIPWLPPGDTSHRETNPRTRIINGLAGLLKSCTRNRSMCCAAGLFQVLLGAAETIFTKKVDGNFTSAKWNAHCLLDLLAVLGSHCLSVQDLKTWLKAISACIPNGRSVDLILPLERALIDEEAKGPSHTFEFDGESSGLLGPGESRWPFVNGYAFATWLYIESFADTVHTAATAAAIAAAAVAKSGKSSAMSAAAAASALAGEGTAHMPRLFSFLSAENQGLEAYFHGQFLVVESASSKGKKASLHFTYNFKPRHWYFIGIEHTFRQSILGKTESEVKLHVDGNLCKSRTFEFPRVYKPLAFCCIGTNPPPTMAGLQRCRRLCPLFAEMGPVCIFKKPIGEDRMGRLAARGGLMPLQPLDLELECLAFQQINF